MATHVSKKDFAAIYGCSKAYVSQLGNAARLVLNAEGKVDVEATLELLGVTSDPSKAGVRERWAAYREGRAFDGTATGAAALPAAQPEAPQLALEAAAEPPAAPPPAAQAEPRTSAYHDARTLNEQAKARMAQLELQKALGEALEAESTLRAVIDAHTTARAELLMLPDRLAQLVAPEIDPRRCHDLIQAEVERVAARLAERLGALGAAAAATQAQAQQQPHPEPVAA